MRIRLRSARIRAIAVSTAVALVAELAALPVYAGEPGAPAVQLAPARATAENVQVAFNTGVATISYDLTAFEGQGTFEVTLEISTDGGQSYNVIPRTVNGDIGQAVAAGRGKRIVWEAAKDVESLQTDRFRFRIVITVEARSEDPGQLPPVPPVTPPGVSTQPPRVSRGNPLLWPGLGIFGAGGALAAAAAAGPLRKKTDYPGFYELTPNTTVIFGGLGVAGVGVLLMLLGRRGASNTASIVPIRGGVMLYRATTF